MKFQLLNNQNQPLQGAKYWAAIAAIYSAVSYGSIELGEGFSPAHKAMEIYTQATCETE